MYRQKLARCCLACCLAAPVASRRKWACNGTKSSHPNRDLRPRLILTPAGKDRHAWGIWTPAARAVICAACGREAASRWPHKPEVAGSIPARATLGRRDPSNPVRRPNGANSPGGAPGLAERRDERRARFWPWPAGRMGNPDHVPASASNWRGASFTGAVRRTQRTRLRLGTNGRNPANRDGWRAVDQCAGRWTMPPDRRAAWMDTR